MSVCFGWRQREKGTPSCSTKLAKEIKKKARDTKDEEYNGIREPAKPFGRRKPKRESKEEKKPTEEEKEG